MLPATISLWQEYGYIKSFVGFPIEMYYRLHEIQKVKLSMNIFFPNLYWINNRSFQFYHGNLYKLNKNIIFVCDCMEVYSTPVYRPSCDILARFHWHKYCKLYSGC